MAKASRVELEQKKQRLLTLVAEPEEAIVAFSGGVDSALLLRMRTLVCPSRTRAFLGLSPAVPLQDRWHAMTLCKEWGVPLWQLETGEWKEEAYARNESSRCFYCKSTLFALVEKLSELGVKGTIFYGANSDDQRDYRPGMQAAKAHNIRAPLLEAGLRKEEVRVLAREAGVPIWDKPASPCLSSRVLYGERIEPEKLKKISLAESFMKALGFQELRVRYYPQDRAKIELSSESFIRLLHSDLRERIVRGIKSLGFKEVLLDLEPHRSGKLNVDLESTEREH